MCSQRDDAEKMLSKLLMYSGLRTMMMLMMKTMTIAVVMMMVMTMTMV